MIAVSAVRNHERFNWRTLHNDIAVVWLRSAINDQPATVAVVPLPPQSAGVATGARAYVAGWGHMRAGGTNAPRLRAVQVPIVAPQVCESQYIGRITAGMLCAGYTGRDACQNDEGGPLTVNGLLVGVSSWGTGCGQANRPGVYTRVAYYRNWINTNI